MELYEMKYIEALKLLYEVMKNRPDIKEVVFDKENDKFAVKSDRCVHICFGSELRK